MIGGVSNFLLLQAVIISRPLKSKFYTIVMNIAVADLSFGLLINLSNIVMEYYKVDGWHYEMLSKIHNVTGIFLCSAAIVFSALLNFDRLIFLKYPEKYKVISIKSQISFIYFCWCFELTFGLLSLILRFDLVLLLLSIIVIFPALSVIFLTVISYWLNLRPSNNSIAVRQNEKETISVSSSWSESTSIRQFSLPTYTVIPGVATVDTLTFVSLKNNIRRTTNLTMESEKIHKFRFGIGYYELKIVSNLFAISMVILIFCLPLAICSFYLYFCISCGPLNKSYVKQIIVIIMSYSAVARPCVVICRLPKMRNTLRSFWKNKFSTKNLYLVKD